MSWSNSIQFVDNFFFEMVHFEFMGDMTQTRRFIFAVFFLVIVFVGEGFAMPIRTPDVELFGDGFGDEDADFIMMGGMIRQDVFNDDSDIVIGLTGSFVDEKFEMGDIHYVEKLNKTRLKF